MKKILAVLLCLISVISACLMGGCNMYSYDPEDHERKEGGFTYYLIDDEWRFATLFRKATGAVIFGAEEKEELIIPEKLGGYPVKTIGAYYQILAGGTTHYGIYAKNIKRIIINHDVSVKDYGISNFEGYLVVNYPIRFYDYFYYYKYTIQINCNSDLMEDYEKNINNLGVSQYEIKFDAVGGEKTTWTTIIWEDNFLPEPENPTKEGYEFAGWYVDEVYKTQWNFETDTVSKSMTLYAKWI